MEGHCTMAVSPLVVSSDLRFPTEEYCQKICNAEPMCSYYFYGSQKKSCELYPKAQKVCTDILGRIDCSNGNFEGIHVLDYFFYYINTNEAFLINILTVWIRKLELTITSE